MYNNELFIVVIGFKLPKIHKGNLNRQHKIVKILG